MGTMERVLPQVGERIQRYELIEEIGRGGFGAVFRARQHGLDAEVAIKVMLPTDGTSDHDSAQLYERFEQEARLSKELEHPCAIKVRDYGRTNRGLPYLVSEFVRGRDLDELIATERFPITRIVRIAAQVLGCLAEAHHRGIVHRDLKPSNIKLRDIFGEQDSVKVLDFGIAKVSEELGGVQTQTGLSFGTPHYMSPEQCRGAPDIDGRSDLYALALIMAECISGEQVVRGTELMQIVYAHSRPEELEFHPDVMQSPLYPIIRRATTKDRDRRYANAIEMRDALLTINTGSWATPGAGTPSAPQPTRPDLIRPGPSTPSPAGPAPFAPLAEVETQISRPVDTGSHEPLGTDAGPLSSRSRAPWILLVVFVLVAAALGAFAVFGLPRSGDGAASGPVNTEGPPPRLTPPEPETVTAAEREGPAAAEPTTTPAERGPAPAQPEMVAATESGPAEASAGTAIADVEAPAEAASEDSAASPPHGVVHARVVTVREGEGEAILLLEGCGSTSGVSVEDRTVLSPTQLTGVVTRVHTTSCEVTTPAQASALSPVSEVVFGEPAEPRESDAEAIPPAVPEPVVARIEGNPSRARVRLGDETVCRRLPCDIEIEPGDDDAEARVTASGYHSTRLLLSRREARVYAVELEREPREREPPDEPEEPEPPENPGGPSLREVPLDY